MKTRIYYQVTFYSPGSLFSESNFKEYPILNFVQICKDAKKIKQRYNSAPYGFVWSKLELPVKIPKIEGYEVKIDPKVLEKSTGTIFITGEIIYSENLTEKENSILKSNLESNNDGVGVINTNSYKFYSGFEKGDFIIDWGGNIIRSGNDKDLTVYRNKFRKNKGK